MKTRTAILMFALLSGAAGAALADVRIHIDCKAAGAHCPPPPTPPRPPAPPAPDAAMASSPADVAMPAMPAIPAPPAPPAPPLPPPPPKLPPVPDSAHAECASKKPGTRLSFTLQPGETMSGVCRRQGGKMVFELRDYERRE
jgi:hypothetical protein